MDHSRMVIGDKADALAGDEEVRRAARDAGRGQPAGDAILQGDEMSRAWSLWRAPG
jgi:hypothetical protein